MKLVVNLLVFLMLLLTSCTRPDELSPTEYARFIEDKSNNLRKEVKVQGLKYIVQYKPIEFVALKEMNSLLDTSIYKNRISELSGTVWFNIYIQSEESNNNPLKDNVSGLNEYNNRLEYFLKRAASNFNLYYGEQGSMNTVAYHFENNYGLTPMDVIVVGFKIPDSRPNDDIILEYNDMLFDNGPIKVKFTKKQLSEIPEIIL